MGRRADRDWDGSAGVKASRHARIVVERNENADASFSGGAP